jgi:hypothetical protein
MRVIAATRFLFNQLNRRSFDFILPLGPHP